VVRRIYQTLPALLASGLTVLLVEQDVSQALRVATHSLPARGPDHAAGPPGDLTAEEIEGAYFGLAGVNGSGGGREAPA
jgi:ABC-type branched-chain amino acid transport systems, ATPase component